MKGLFSGCKLFCSVRLTIVGVHCLHRVTTSKDRFAVSTAIMMTSGSPSIDSVAILYFHCHLSLLNSGGLSNVHGLSKPCITSSSERFRSRWSKRAWNVSFAFSSGLPSRASNTRTLKSDSLRCVGIYPAIDILSSPSFFSKPYLSSRPKYRLTRNHHLPS